MLLVWCFYCLRFWCNVQEVIGSGLVHWENPEESGGEGGGRGDQRKKKKKEKENKEREERKKKVIGKIDIKEFLPIFPSTFSFYI